MFWKPNIFYHDQAAKNKYKKNAADLVAFKILIVSKSISKNLKKYIFLVLKVEYFDYNQSAKQNILNLYQKKNVSNALTTVYDNQAVTDKSLHDHRAPVKLFFRV